ncbi:MAG: adenylate/guanylate cyclase domain-containing protein [Desulfobacter sp.]|nr:adenylate/guanylate cyclase domain-containing protein [Desulfobacter sp.]
MRSKRPFSVLFEFYLMIMGATFMAMLVILVMNLSTPFEFTQDRIGELSNPGWWGIILARFLILSMATVFSSLPAILLVGKLLKPVTQVMAMGPQNAPDILKKKARQRLINMPFIFVPVNIGLWVIIPMCIFIVFYKMDLMDWSTALTFSLRATMVGFISSAIIFFSLEAYLRRTLIPLFFPQGRLADVSHTRRISIDRRIRAFYRMGSLIPLTHIVLTLFVLFLQVDDNPMSTREYAKSVFIFSLVVFGVFWVGSGLLTRLISQSIAAPVNEMVTAVKAVRIGDYNTRVEVVSNDEIGILGDAFNQAIQGLKDRERIRDAFGRYVDPKVRDEILSGSIPLDGEYKEVTILFADLRDFTPFTATHDPKKVVKMLNAYFKAMGAAVKENKGLILQFLGDEIYAVFGAPVTDENHPSNAIKAAFDMEKRLEDLNRDFTANGLPKLSHGIGIHTGTVLAANIGSPDRLSYLLVGDAVNLAPRLQAMTRDIHARIIVSKETMSFLPRGFDMGLLAPYPHPVHLKGVDQDLNIYHTRA